MDIKDILLFLKAGAPCEASLEVAARLAREHDGQVVGVCLFEDPDPPIADGYAIGPNAVGEVLERRRARILDLAAPAEAAFERIVARRGLSAGWTLGEPDETPQVSAARARFADLVIAGRPQAHDRAGRVLVETLALATGTPCLMVGQAPARSSGFERIVLAWNGSREAKRATDDGLEFLRCAKTVSVAIVEERVATGATSSLDQPLLRHLARHGVHAQVERIAPSHRGAGEALLSRCRSFKADLLIMGAYGHARAAELILGGATRSILAHAEVPVLLSH